MKRTWIVYVQMGVGHELSDSFSETDIYGPFTEEVAEELAKKLNLILDDGSSEHLEATASQLDTVSVRQILDRYRSGTRLSHADLNFEDEEE